MRLQIWPLLKNTVNGYIADEALSRGAAIAYYTIFSIAPVLIIAVAVAGFAFGQDAAEGAIATELEGLLGRAGAETVQSMVKSAGHHEAGVVATIIGVVTLLITATGVFSEMQSALNAVWKAEPNRSAVGRLVRARLASMGLVVTLGFLLMVSLIISAALTAIGAWLNGVMPGTQIAMRVVSLVVSFTLVALLFAAVYKVLPDKRIAWRDVAIGSVATAALFSIGKYLIGLYIGGSSVASTYGAAGAVLVVLLWIYYSAQIFLLGAEFTRAYAELHGSHAGRPVAAATAVSPDAAHLAELRQLANRR